MQTATVHNRFLGAFMAFILIFQSAEAAIAPMSAPGEASPTAGASAVEAAGDPAYAEDHSKMAKSTSGVVLPKTPITMNFHEADIRDVLRLLALKSGMNIIYGADVSGPITLHLDRVPFDQAFQTV